MLEDYLAGKTLSLVGNATSLLQQGYGARIDSNEVVIRLNKGHYFLLEHPKALGIRTDVLAIARPVDGHKSLDLKFLVYICGFEECKKRSPELLNLSNLVLFSQQHRKTFADKWLDGRWPTTGLTMFDFLYEVCKFKRLDIFGFDFFATASLFMASKNQWNDNHKRWHRPELEKAYMLERISSDERIKLWS